MMKPIGFLLIALMALSGPAAEYGADVPFTTHEAESLKTTGTVIALRGLPGPNEASAEIEASGRSYVRLSEVGEYCEFEVKERGNALVLRHSIPDAPEGGGTTATISLYVNGKFRQKISLDSRYNWLYGSASRPHGGHSNNPQDGRPHLFWNDTRVFLDEPWTAGDVLRLQKDVDDKAEYYGLDLIDTELAPAPLEAPPDGTFVSVTDFGAIANDEIDDSAAIRAGIEAAKEQGKTLWFPAGTFFHSQMFPLDGVQVQGAGMWHTELIGTGPMLGFVLMGVKPRVADLFVESTAHHTRTDPGGMVFRSRRSTDWSVENVWITHVHCGFWLGQASHGSIRGCRLYGTYADAINLNRGSSHNVVENNYLRTTGDDGIATLAETKDPDIITEGNTFRFNTVVANWWGHNIDVAGGHGHVVENNYLADNSHSGCFTFNLPSAYPMHPLTGAIVRNNMIVRGGGNHAGQERGAVWSFADDSPISGVVFENNQIIDPIFRGLHLHGRSQQEMVFKNNTIENPGTDAVRIDATVKGKLIMTGNDIHGLKDGYHEIDNAAGGEFEVIDAKVD